MVDAVVQQSIPILQTPLLYVATGQLDEDLAAAMDAYAGELDRCDRRLGLDTLTRDCGASRSCENTLDRAYGAQYGYDLGETPIPSETSPAYPSPTSSPKEGEDSPEPVAGALLGAWRLGDRDEAEKVAESSAVDVLFSMDPTGWSLVGCSPAGNGYFFCKLSNPSVDGEIELGVDTSPTGFRVVDASFHGE